MSPSLSKFVVLGPKTKRVALRLLKNGRTYWRDAGAWGVGWKVKDGKLVSASNMKWLRGLRLVKISKKEWEEMVAGAMQMVKVAASGEIGQPEGFALASAADDDWEAWNAERDKAAGITE